MLVGCLWKMSNEKSYFKGYKDGYKKAYRKRIKEYEKGKYSNTNKQEFLK